MTGYLDDLVQQQRDRFERELEAKRSAMELADVELRQQVEFQHEKQVQELNHDNAKQMMRMEHQRRKAEIRGQLEAELLGIQEEAQQAERVAAEQEYALRLQTGGRATFEALERQQQAAAAPVNSRALEELTRAVTRLCEMQSAPRVVQRDGTGRVVAVTIGEERPTLPGTLGGGRDARAR